MHTALGTAVRVEIGKHVSYPDFEHGDVRGIAGHETIRAACQAQAVGKHHGDAYIKITKGTCAIDGFQHSARVERLSRLLHAFQILELPCLFEI